uniref:Uncharacterized protein n=1 Tax=Tanacetum cinerariifolium TaxID=118510 RepID=A0A6L2LRL1_TANCI|nr:hypothetical protein [Tanacetum cinerariifolium]
MLVAHEVKEGNADENVKNVNVGDTAKGDVSDAHNEVSTADEEPSIPSPTPYTLPPQPSHDIPSTSQLQPTPPQSPHVQPQSPQPQPQQDAGIPTHILQEVIDTCTALTRRIEHMELDKISQALEITRLKRRVKKLEWRNKGRIISDMDADADVVLEEAKDAKVNESVDIQRRQAESQSKIYKIDVDHANKVLSMQEDESAPAEVQEVVDFVTTAKLITEVVIAASTTISTVEVPVPAATTVTAPKLTAAPSRRTKGVVIRDPKEELEVELNRIIDWDEVIDHVNMKEKDDKSVKRYQAMKRKPQNEAQARKNMTVYLKNVDGFKMNCFKDKDQIDKEESRALKRINETPTEKVAKRSVHGPAKVKGWKLLELRGVQIITFKTTQLILLVERKYPLIRFNLDQMLNVVRLEVEDESDVSSELLSFGVDDAKEFKKNNLSV